MKNAVKIFMYVFIGVFISILLLKFISSKYYDVGGLMFCDYKNLKPTSVDLANSYNIYDNVTAARKKGYEIEERAAWGAQRYIAIKRSVNSSNYLLNIHGNPDNGFWFQIDEIENSCTKPDSVIRSELKEIFEDFSIDNNWIDAAPIIHHLSGGADFL